MKWINDILALAGLGMVGTGLWFVDFRLSLVVVGGLLLAVALQSVRNAGGAQ